MVRFFMVFLLLTLEMYGNLEHVFTHCYHNWSWGRNEESVSGNGSSLHQTKIIRNEVPILLKELEIRSLLDAACGDFNWMRMINCSFLERYIGMDIVAPLIKANKERYEGGNITFLHADMTTAQLPKVDLILCRDVFIHLTYNTIFRALENFKKSGARYLLTTTFPKLASNHDIASDGAWRIINLQIPPFNFPAPIALITEGCDEDNGNYSDKSLGLWDLSTIEFSKK